VDVLLGNGLPDIVSVNGEDDSITGLPATGARTCLTSTGYDAGLNPSATTTGNFTAGPRPDLVVSGKP
jgi:hypothetical protein